MSTMYISGVGNVDLDVYRVHKAVKLYDETLSFQRNPDTGDYCIYKQMPRSPDRPHEIPILGFGQEIPHPDDAVKRLYGADMVRHGVDAILNRIDRHNDELKRANKARADDATGDTADHIEFAMRRVGDSPIVKSTRKQGAKH